MTGVLSISIEIELGWGVHDLPTRSHLSADGRQERIYLRKLLDKADECEIPISFDIVGHLLLDECDGSHGGPYPDGWFDADPGTDAETDGLFFGPDLAREVLAADAAHELCTHTFSHLLCASTTDDLLELELRRVQRLHEELAEPTASFVPPRHSRPNNRVLSRNGIRTARYAKRKEAPTLAHRFKLLTVGPHPEWEPTVEDGVLETYCTSYPSLAARMLPLGQEDTAWMYRPFPLSARMRAHEWYLKRATRRAIKSGTPLHLWCHLYDLSNEYQWEVLETYFEFLAELPEEDLKVRTMDTLTEEYLGECTEETENVTVETGDVSATESLEVK